MLITVRVGIIGNIIYQIPASVGHKPVLVLKIGNISLGEVVCVMHPNPQYIKQVLSHHARLNYFSVCLYKTVLKNYHIERQSKNTVKNVGKFLIYIMLFQMM